MNPPLQPCTRRSELLLRVAETLRMVDRPHLFTPCEVLGQLLGATRLAFAIAGEGEEGTRRGQLYQVINDYIELAGDCDPIDAVVLADERAAAISRPESRP